MANQKDIKGWITINGVHRPLFEGETSRDVYNRLKEQYNKPKSLKEKAQKRFDKLKEKYEDIGNVEKSNGIEYIELKPDAPFQEYENHGRYNDTTQEELNNLPVRFTLYGDSGRYSYIYKNRREWKKNMKESYGGLSQVTDNGRLNYSISSESGIGEYYCERDSNTKGGWKWFDANYDTVKGTEIRKTNFKTREKNFEKKWEKEHPNW